MIVYKISNTINSKLYIGQTTKSIQRRFKEHCKKSSKQTIGKAIQKHGKENFVIEVLFETEDPNLLDEKEKFYIKNLNTMLPSGYNGDSGGNLRRFFSQETKEKLSKACKGLRRSIATEFKVGPRPETKGSGNTMFGKPSYLRKAVICVETGIIYPSIKHTAKAIGVSHSYISRLLNNKSRGRRAKGFTFAYAEADK